MARNPDYVTRENASKKLGPEPVTTLFGMRRLDPRQCYGSMIVEVRFSRSGVPLVKEKE